MNKPDLVSQELLACPNCHLPITEKSYESVNDVCAGCGTEIKSLDGVVIAYSIENTSYFDLTYPIMQESNQKKGTWDLFYSEQISYVESILKPGEVVLDVGCGPNLLYDPKGAYVVGVDTSLPVILLNKKISQGIYSSAAKLPLRAACVDTVLCFYSIHHMTGKSLAENQAIVRQVLAEFKRVLKPTGRILIFDMSPWLGFSWVEYLVWNTAKSFIGSGLDMFFWKDRLLENLILNVMGKGNLTTTTFWKKSFQIFPPIFSKPWLLIPRLLYPFDINLYIWKKSAKIN